MHPFVPENLFGVTGAGFAIGSMSYNMSTDVFTQEFGVPPGIVTGSGQVTASADGLSDSASYDVDLQAPVTIAEAVVIDKSIQSDWQKIRVAFQVRDQYFNTRIDRSGIRIYAQASQPGRSASGNCRPDSTTGICVATVNLGDAWINSGDDISIEYGFSLSNLELHTDTVSVDASPSVTYADNFVAMVPVRPVLAGNDFDVEIVAFAVQDIESAKFTVVVDDPNVLTIDSVTPIYEDTWSYQIQIGSDGFTVVINRKPGGPAVTGSPQEEQHIVTARISISGSAVAGPAQLEIQVKEMNAPNAVRPGGEFIPDGGYVLGNVQGAVANISAPGFITITDDEVVGLLARVENGQGTFLNTAPLSKVSSSSWIRAHEVHRYGTTLREQSQATCTVSANPAFELTASPCSISFTSATSSGSAESIVNISHGALSTTVPIRVWTPVLPVRFETDTQRLGPITLQAGGAQLVDDACDPRYLWTSIKAFVAFQLGDGSTNVTSDEYDITDLLKAHVVAGNNTVVAIDTVAGTVTGKAPGTSTVHFGDASNGNITITVVSTAFHIRSFNVVTFADIDVSVSNSVLDAGSKSSASASFVNEPMTQEGTEAAHRILSVIRVVDPIDQTEYVRDVSSEDAIVYSSSDSAIVAVETNDRVVAVGTGVTSIGGVWNNSQVCASDANALTSRVVASVEVNLPAATNAYFTTSGQSQIDQIDLSHENDAAFLAGAGPSEYRLRVTAVYPEYTRDLTNDPRTHFVYGSDSTGSPFTIEPCVASSGMCARANESVNGTGYVNATFDHESVVAVLEVQVVRGLSLSVRSVAYPGWSGSDAIDKTTIKTISNTGVFQLSLIHI